MILRSNEMPDPLFMTSISFLLVGQYSSSLCYVDLRYVCNTKLFPKQYPDSKKQSDRTFKRESNNCPSYLEIHEQIKEQQSNQSFYKQIIWEMHGTASFQKT